MNEVNCSSSPQAYQPNVIEADRVSKRWGGRLAVGNLSLSIAPGECVALLGPNGAGKSTFLAMVLGLLRPDSGTVRVFGTTTSDRSIRRRIGALLQEVTLPPELTAFELLRLVCAYKGIDKSPAALIEEFGLTPIRDRRCSNLSVGQSRFLQFALATCGNPDLLVLDEPTSSIDAGVREVTWRYTNSVKDRGGSVLIATHDLQEIQRLADRVLVMRDGRTVVDVAMSDLVISDPPTRLLCVTSIHASVVAQWEDVLDVKSSGSSLRILSRQPETTLKRLLVVDPLLSGLEVTRANLEEQIALAELSSQ